MSILSVTVKGGRGFSSQMHQLFGVCS